MEGGGIYARQVARGNCVLGGGRVSPSTPTAPAPASCHPRHPEQPAELYPALSGAQAIRTWSGVEGYLRITSRARPQSHHPRPAATASALPARASSRAGGWRTLPSASCRAPRHSLQAFSIARFPPTQEFPNMRLTPALLVALAGLPLAAVANRRSTSA